MKEFMVRIIETSIREVEIEAEDQCEAEEIIEREWNDSKIILDADDFDNVKFEAYEKK